MQRTLGKGCPKYCTLDEETGELRPLVQPFAVMSLKPAIGREWFEKYNQDIYGHDKDFIVVKTEKRKPARYYDKIYDTINPTHMEKIKQQRVDNHETQTIESNRARAKITHARKIYKTQM